VRASERESCNVSSNEYFSIVDASKLIRPQTPVPATPEVKPNKESKDATGNKHIKEEKEGVNQVLI